MQALPTLSALALLTLAPSILAAQQVERYTLEGDDIAIYNLAGALTVEPGTGSVSVELVRGGRDAARLRVERGELWDRETLRVVYPSQSVAYAGLEDGSSTTLKVRDDGTFGDGGERHHHDHDYDDDDDRPRGRTVRISRDRGDFRAHADLKVRVPMGSRVEFHLAVGRVSIANVNGDIQVDSHSAPVTVTGPKGSFGVDVGSGDVRVSGAEGTLSVDTGSGSVQVTGFRGDELSVDTGSGQVSGSELSARSINVDTGSGDIELTAVTCPELALETGSGSISTDLRGPVRDLSLETGSGDISVRAPATLAGEVEIETASGEIETDFPIQVTRHARDHVVGRIGDGVGRVAIETGSGNVRLLKAAN
jgi:lia operon protein LiaG